MNSRMDAKRLKTLLPSYINSKEAGLKEDYDIKHVAANLKDFNEYDYDDYEHYFILLHPRTGIYRDQVHILEMKTRYPNSTDMYPMQAPIVKFITKMYHTNVSDSGSICLDILKDRDKWSPTYDFSSIIRSICLLLEDPNNSSPFNGEASRDYVKCEQTYKARKANHMSVAELDALKDECFAEFKNKADRLARTNKIDAFNVIFPQLLNKNNKQHIHDDLQELKTIYESIGGKKKVEVKEDDTEKKVAEKPKIDPKKFDKYRKK